MRHEQRRPITFVRQDPQHVALRVLRARRQQPAVIVVANVFLCHIRSNLSLVQNTSPHNSNTIPKPAKSSSRRKRKGRRRRGRSFIDTSQTDSSAGSVDPTPQTPALPTVHLTTGRPLACTRSPPPPTPTEN